MKNTQHGTQRDAQYDARTLESTLHERREEVLALHGQEREQSLEPRATRRKGEASPRETVTLPNRVMHRRTSSAPSGGKVNTPPLVLLVQPQRRIGRDPAHHCLLRKHLTINAYKT